MTDHSIWGTLFVAMHSDGLIRWKVWHMGVFKPLSSQRPYHQSRGFWALQPDYKQEFLHWLSCCWLCSCLVCFHLLNNQINSCTSRPRLIKSHRIKNSWRFLQLLRPHLQLSDILWKLRNVYFHYKCFFSFKTWHFYQ